MRNKLIYLGLFAAIGLWVLAGCAQSTTLTGTWMDDAYKERSLKKVLVIGFAEDAVVRRIFETELARQFELRGVQATPGHRVLPEGERLEKVMIASRVKGMGVDGVIVTKLVRSKTERERITDVSARSYPPSGSYYPGVRPAYRDWYGDYAGSYGSIRRTEYIIEYKVVTLETNLYGAASERPVWSALSETVVEGVVQDEIVSFSEVVVDKLAEDGLIKGSK
ncbi:MAG: hypothetical protein C0617_05055 [Desulfuromonas sp.]|uniref:hypothetical protein n=1 Tax=Desulfuromonas sp. TaxID=892 RepID=UPI000CC731FB|nr:hypothetical protein [Desulfuromonas sp.]PLX85062.1 MAG: hypothetical protein C0617_05055 [Desulfuromonas sp.]